MTEKEKFLTDHESRMNQLHDLINSFNKEEESLEDDSEFMAEVKRQRAMIAEL